MLAIKALKPEAARPSGPKVAESLVPMTGPKLLTWKLNGWALSLMLHGGLAAIAGLSVFTVQMDGGSGNGGNGGLGHAQSFPAIFRSGEETFHGVCMNGIKLRVLPKLREGFDRARFQKLRPELFEEDA